MPSCVTRLYGCKMAGVLFEQLVPGAKITEIHARVTSRQDFRVIESVGSRRNRGFLLCCLEDEGFSQVNCFLFDIVGSVGDQLLHVDDRYSFHNLEVRVASLSVPQRSYPIEFISCAETYISTLQIPENLTLIPLESVQFVSSGSSVCVAGRVIEVGSVLVRTTKNGQRRVLELKLQDWTDAVTRLTLWEGEIDSLPNSRDPWILLALDVVVDVFANRTRLKTARNSRIWHCPPNDGPLRQLYEWNDQNRMQLAREAVPASFPLRIIKEVTDSRQIATTVTILGIRTQPAPFYSGCIIESCRSRAKENIEGTGFTCVKQGHMAAEFVWRYVAQLHIADCTGEAIVTAFDTVISSLLNRPASEVHELSIAQIEAVFGALSFVLVDMRLRIQTTGQIVVEGASFLDIKARIATLEAQVSIRE